MGDPLALLKAHGRNATSFQLLEPGIEHWFSGKHEAFVGYADTGSAWVVLGEPVCRPEVIREVISEFESAAAKASRRVRFFGLETDIGVKTLVVGEQPEWDRGAWQRALAAKANLREQLRRARAKGVTIEKVGGGEAKAELEALAAEWARSRRMATMHFAVRLDLFHHGDERRYFIARRDGAVVGALIAVPVYARNGWLLEDLLRTGAAPNGTTELLIDAAMTELADADVISMGLAPLSNVDSKLLELIRELTPSLFDWHGLRAFKAKLAPSRWQKVSAGWNRGSAVFAMADVLRCFAGGSLLGFAGSTAIHRYRAILWLLAILLVPWVAILSTPMASGFFPSADARLGWIAFDTLMFAGLIRLALAPTRPLAQLLALGAGADFIVGALQVATWNVGATKGFGWVAVSVALVAPAIACFFLAKFANCERLTPDRTEVADPVAT